MKGFVFRITELCNKKCETCCCGLYGKSIAPQILAAKLAEISDYCVTAHLVPIIGLTGGEAFLYRGITDRGANWNIVDVAEQVFLALPTAQLFIKTSGWTANAVLDSRLKALRNLSKYYSVEIRLGFNLFQNSGLDASPRLAHMIQSMLEFGESLRVEVIYNRHNFASTFRLIREVLEKYGVPSGVNLSQLIVNPRHRHTFHIPLNSIEPDSNTEQSECSNHTLQLESMPAYPGLGCSVDPANFYSAQVYGPCHNIINGPDYILYNPDLSFHHCNDAFADYSLPPYGPFTISGVADEVAFLDRRFSVVRTFFSERQVVLDDRRERCLLCSKLIHECSTLF